MVEVCVEFTQVFINSLEFLGSFCFKTKGTNASYKAIKPSIFAAASYLSITPSELSINSLALTLTKLPLLDCFNETCASAPNKAST